MNRILAVAGLVGALSVAGIASVPSAEAQDYRDYRSYRVRGEPQPHMYNALRYLEQAEQALLAASNDKGGNRREALEHVRKAQRDVRQGIRHDNRH